MNTTQIIMRAFVAGGVAFLVAGLLFGMGDEGGSPAVIGGTIGAVVGTTITLTRTEQKKLAADAELRRR
ncbi:MAG: hypothetical protein ACF8LK_03095 [Phycisphaerales bacterium JB041]